MNHNILIWIYAVIILRLLSFNSFASELRWEAVPLRSEKQKEIGLKGGEGFQMTMSISYSKSNPNVVYTSSDTSQIWKSVDEGRSWVSMHKGFRAHGARSVFVDPVNPNIVLAAAFLGKNYDYAKNEMAKVEGIYMSIDGAENWTLVHNTGFYRQEDSRGNLFATDSRSIEGGRTRILYAGSYNDGLLRSDDFGRSWESVGLVGIPITTVVEDPDALGDLYVATEKGLFSWSNGVATSLGKGLPDWPRSIDIDQIGVLYCAIGDGGVYKSIDKGISFTRLLNGLPVWGKFTDVAVSPVDKNIVYVKLSEGLNRGPYFSHDAGLSWHDADSWNKEDILPHETLFWFSGQIVPHPKESMKALIASNGKGMILRTDDGGANWEYSASGFTGGRMTNIVFLGEDSLMIGLFDHGLFISDDGGDTFYNISDSFPSAKKTILACSGNKNTLVAIIESLDGEYYIAVSNNRGLKWRYIKNIETDFLPAYTGFESDGNTIYAGHYRSDDQGATWKELAYAVMAIGGEQGDTLYTLKDDSSGKCQVMSSNDKGETWQPISPMLPFSKKQITDIAISPELPAHIFIAANWKGLWALYSGQWNQINLDQSQDNTSIVKNVVDLVEIDPINPKRILVGTWAPGVGQGNGVFESVDGGKSFSNITGSIGPELSIWGISISPFDSTVYVGTSRGTYKLSPIEAN